MGCQNKFPPLLRRQERDLSGKWHALFIVTHGDWRREGDGRDKYCGKSPRKIRD